MILNNVHLNALEPLGTAGELQFDLIKSSFLVMLGVFVIVVSLFVYVLVRYRAKKNVHIVPEQVHGNTKLEIIWTIIPFILLAILAYPSIKSTFLLDDISNRADALTVKVTGHQYWWEFEYPSLGIKTAQELHMPVGKKVIFEVDSTDVLHSFWIPALGGKIDVIPGLTNTLWLDAKRAGMFQGKCAELCGAGHALMDFKVFADTDEGFAKWVSTMQSPPVDSKSSNMLSQGEAIFKKNCIGCHAGINKSIIGPDLNKFGTRSSIGGILKHDKENLKKWLVDSPKLKPGSKMPKIDYLEPDEMDSLIQYLESRK